MLWFKLLSWRDPVSDSFQFRINRRALNGRLSNYLGKQATTVLAETTILADFRGLTSFSATYDVTFISGHQYLANHQMEVGNRRMTADLVAPPVDAIYQSPSIDEYQAPDRPAPPPPQEINYQPPPASSVDEYSAPVQYTAPAGQETYQPPPPGQEPYQLPPGKQYPIKPVIRLYRVEFPLIFDRPAQVPTVFIFHKIAPLIDDPKKFQSDLIFSVKENSYKPPPPAAAPSEQYPPSTVPKKKQHFFHYVNFPAWNEFEFGWNKGENKKNQSVANDWWKKEELRSMHSQHFKNLYEN